MSTFKKIAALTIVAGGMIAAGMGSSADAGFYGGYCAPSYGYGYNYYQPSYLSYPSYDVYGGNYFSDSYGIRHNCYATSYANQYYYYDSYGAPSYFYGY